MIPIPNWLKKGFRGICISTNIFGGRRHRNFVMYLIFPLIRKGGQPMWKIALFSLKGMVWRREWVKFWPGTVLLPKGCMHFWISGLITRAGTGKRPLILSASYFCQRRNDWWDLWQYISWSLQLPVVLYRISGDWEDEGGSGGSAGECIRCFGIPYISSGYRTGSFYCDPGVLWRVAGKRRERYRKPEGCLKRWL